MVYFKRQKNGTLSDQENQFNPYRGKKFWIVGYKWRRFQIVKKGVIVYGMGFYEKSEVLWDEEEFTQLKVRWKQGRIW